MAFCIIFIVDFLKKVWGDEFMHVILLAGGKGTRLWPISTEELPKQFIKIFDNQSMLQNMVHRFPKNTKIVLSTNTKYQNLVKEQLGSKVAISAEPCFKGTFPAIALACLYLKDVMKVPIDERIVVCPSDSYVDQSYYPAIKQLTNIIDTKLCLMGVEPTYPAEKYGYIIPHTKDKISKVKCFKEKPSTNLATEYINQGALWNCGVFSFDLDYILNKSNELLGVLTYESLLENYDKLENNSFDTAITEKEDDIKVLRYSGQWDDLGTWDSLYKYIKHQD